MKSAEALFMRYGVRSISMDDIARHLSVSKKTLYHHFADKDDMVSTVCQNHLQQGLKEFEEIRLKSENAIDELRLISLCIRRNMEDTNPSLLFDLQKFHPKAWNIWLDHRNRYMKASIIRNLEQGMKEGYFRADLDPEIIAALRLINIESVFDVNIFPKDKFKAVYVQEQIFEHFVYGICTDKGKKLFQKYKENNNVQPQLTPHNNETIL